MVGLFADIKRKHSPVGAYPVGRALSWITPLIIAYSAVRKAVVGMPAPPARNTWPRYSCSTRTKSSVSRLTTTCSLPIGKTALRIRGRPTPATWGHKRLPTHGDDAAIAFSDDASLSIAEKSFAFLA